MWTVFAKGAATIGGLIIAIGAQNAFVLKQGLLKAHVLPVVLLCFACDIVLCTLGVFGLGSALGNSRTWSGVLALGGALFLLYYGWRSLRTAFSARHAALRAAGAHQPDSLKAVLATTLAVTLLNPHVYIDTLMLVGGVAASLPDNTQKAWFLAGGVCASGLWFFALGFGARLLEPLFAKPRAWQVLECVIGVVMWWLAWGLLRFVWQVFGGAA